MITIFNHSFNSISQDFYDNCLQQLDLHRLTCSCGHSACLTKHAYYFRRIKTVDGFISLRICRVKCTFCNKTHALLPAELVPYSQIPFLSHISIIISSLTATPDYRNIMNLIPDIDENNIHYVVSKFRHFWKERLLSEKIDFSDISLLLKRCFSCFHRQFMQIKNTINILFLSPT